jgi:hypothetical protein
MQERTEDDEDRCGEADAARRLALFLEAALSVASDVDFISSMSSSLMPLPSAVSASDRPAPRDACSAARLFDLCCCAGSTLLLPAPPSKGGTGPEPMDFVKSRMRS